MARPLIVTAGLLDNEMWSDELMLAPRPGFEQKEVTRQFTKILLGLLFFCQTFYVSYV